jgi:putative NADH-flavin reductase
MSAAAKKTLTVGVIGPAGFGGSYVCLELIRRGHHIIGISRHPEKLGSHPLYTPRRGDIAELSIEELAETFRGVDVLVNEYGPHTGGAEALKYSTCIPLY